MIKLLLSISSLFVLFSSLPLLLQSLKPFLEIFLIDKSYMFLLCNGLVVFILSNSGLVDVKKGLEVENINPPEATEEKEEDRSELVASDEKEEEEAEEEEEEEWINDLSIVTIEEEEEEEEGIDDCAIAAIGEKEGDTDDEFKQKVEEFIRKMKESISKERGLLQ